MLQGPPSLHPSADAELDSVLHDRDGFLVGAFRCPTTHPRFNDSGPIQNDIFVFPRSSVRIRHAGGPSFVADQCVATVYNRGQIYDRRAVADEGDRSDWFAVPRAAALDAVLAHGLEPGVDGPFAFPFVSVSDESYLAQRRLFRRVQQGMTARAVEEEVYALLDDIVCEAAARTPRRKVASRRDMGSRELREIGEAARAMISARFSEDWPLARLSERFGVSAFCLCRAFRKATGTTIHRYLLTLRLRAALDRLEDPEAGITALALDLGFSSHSHFTALFGRSFRETPSACRQSLGA
ncbi:MAG: AraC family transcriptional regulator [Vicinamibacteria bacterium]|nr:AraC family transcriptional regulator [Vicinamibacteria bacterium]